MNFKSFIKNHKIVTLILGMLFFTLLIFLFKNNFYYNKIENEIFDSASNNSNEINNANDEEKTATIASTGDILLHSPVLKSCYISSSNSYNFDDVFSYLKPYIKNYDYSVANLECSISNSSWGYSGYPLFKIPENILDSTKDIGFDLLLTANNHFNDGGSKGILNTMSTLSQKNISFIGSRTEESSNNYIVKDINGIKFGMINYTYGQIFDDDSSSLNGNKLSNNTSKLVNIFDYNKLEKFYCEISNSIENMKKDGADAIVLYIHWGNEYELKPNKYQKEIAQKMCELGVDVIVGGHPHVIQPIDILEYNNHKTICIYSTGNIISNQRINLMNLKTGHTEDGILFSVKFSKVGNNKVKVKDIAVLPTWVRLLSYKGEKKYKIIPIDKNKDFNKEYNLGSDLDQANKSYDRTMNLVKDGLTKFKNLKD